MQIKLGTCTSKRDINMSDNFELHLHKRATEAIQAAQIDLDKEGGEVSVQHYISETRTRKELELLRNYPQPVAGSSSLHAPNSWLSLTYFDVPLLLVRQADNTVQAFLNVCRHRGARVVPEGSGTEARTFVCPYHAWTYKPDGSLRAVPESYGFPCLKKEESGLRRLTTVERAGVIWVTLDPTSSIDPNTHFGALMENLESLDGLENPITYATRSYEVKANWKLLVDGSFEAYHFKIAHRKTIAHMFLSNLQIVDEFNLNRRLYLIKSKFANEKPDITNFNPRLFGNITYFFFPNTTLLVQPDHIQLSCLEPVNASLTRIHELTIIPENPISDKAKAHWDANVELYQRTLAEDYALAESIQRGLASGANATLTFGTFEYSAPRFHAQVQQQLDQIQDQNST